MLVTPQSRRDDAGAGLRGVSQARPAGDATERLEEKPT
jgi:hypothetical protein